MIKHILALFDGKPAVKAEGLNAMIEEAQRGIDRPGHGTQPPWGGEVKVVEKPVIVEKLVSGREVLQRLLSRANEKTVDFAEKPYDYRSYYAHQAAVWNEVAREIHTILCAPWFEEGQPSHRREPPEVTALHQAIHQARLAVIDNLPDRAKSILSDPYHLYPWKNDA